MEFLSTNCLSIAPKSKVIKRPNRQITRRLEGLVSKLLVYGELDSIELAFIVYNSKKDHVYSYLSSRDISWLGQVEKMVSPPLLGFYPHLTLSAIGSNG
jgi:hypothetical protein